MHHIHKVYGMISQSSLWTAHGYIFNFFFEKNFFPISVYMVYVHSHVVMYTYICINVCVCTCMWRLETDIALHLIFETVFLWTLNLIRLAIQSASGIHWSVHSSIPHWRYTQHHAQLLCGCWRSGLMSSCLYTRHFIYHVCHLSSP